MSNAERPVVPAGREAARPIDRFGSRGASAVHLGSGRGDAHVYVLHLEAGGEIGPHEAGFDQVYLVVSGRGWVAGAGGARVDLGAGQATRIRKGEVHAKGAYEPLTAVMVQVDTIED